MYLPHIVKLAIFAAHACFAANSTYFNPVLPGWHSDPSIVYVDGTFYAATSTFLVYPGIPIYTSPDLIHWKLTSHVWTRASQLPNAGRDVAIQQGGFFAPTLRHKDGVFYVINVYLGGPSLANGSLLGTIYNTTNIVNSSAWSDPVYFNSPSIDPDLFWDDDGKVYVHTAGIKQQEIDLTTGKVSNPISVWNGTGGSNPEGPHMYKKDGWYYLMIAEGGTELGHRETIARSRHVSGPFVSNPSNPLVTNSNTSEYFQTVGHADLVFDGKDWWGLALSTRSGPEWEIYPMGRETVLFPVSWEEGKWPVATQVRGIMDGWELPPYGPFVSGPGPFNNDPDVVDFAPGSSLPPQFVTWRYPEDDVFAISEDGHPNTLRIRPSRANLTGIPGSTTQPALTGQSGISFIGRRQVHTLFTYSVDLEFKPQDLDQEAGISVLLTQLNHIDLGIALSRNTSQSDHPSQLEIRLRTEGSGTPNGTVPSSLQTFALPESCNAGGDIRLEVTAINSTTYMLSVKPANNANEKVVIGYVSALVVSGGSGPFTGTLLGVYATCNGGKGSGNECSSSGGNAYFSRWRYQGAAEQYSFTEFLPSTYGM